MVVGTASHVGKSLVVTALCRILHRKGIRVAPFKAQNIALNSAVCDDGAEIDRAQAAQAAASGLEPHVDMNPILLKPTTGGRLQVILEGRVHGAMTGEEYSADRGLFFERARAAHGRLAERFEVIVMEGAGSAAEVNLRDRDFVNLSFAEAVGAEALLVADIDRGDVFASLIGTMDLLKTSERKIVRGFIVNKFRGEASLFDDGVCFLEERTQLPCYGVLPYIERLRIDQEDGVALDEHDTRPASFRVGVVQLPHISNFTDFNALEGFAGVGVEYLRSPSGPPPDLLIIPGSKNTIRDLEWVRETGFDRYVEDARRHSSSIVGICGGYQMLGRLVSDPDGVEVEAGASVAGLGLLDVETELVADKTTVRSGGRSFLGPRVEGYEIHMGRTRVGGDAPPFAVKDDGTPDGLAEADVVGTYFHGIFDNEEFTRMLLERVAERRGLRWRPGASSYSRETEYDRLADTASAHLRVDLLEELLSL